MNRGALASLARFDLGEATAEPVFAARGAQGSVWKVSTVAGTYAVKVLQPWVDVPALPFDVVVQRAASDAGIRMPRPVLAADGRAVVDRVRVYEWVDLAPAIRAPVSAARAAEAGDLLGRIHRLGVESVGPPDRWYVTPPSREEWHTLLADAHAKGVDSPWIDAVAADVGFLVEVGAQYTIEPVGPLITCHLDFGPDNVRPALDDGGLVVLDWENTGPLTADAELAEALVDWTIGLDGTVDVDAARRLHAAYGRETVITPRSFAMEAVTALNFLQVLIEHLVYDFDGNDPEFAETALPAVAPDVLRARLGAIDHLVRAL